jgi:2-isopropylmalate synthase
MSEKNARDRGDNYVYLFDTTLRDGAQTQGIDFSVPDKIAISEALDDLGVDYIEGGWPGANHTDDAFFADPPAFTQARFVAFGMTRRAGRSASNDPTLAPVLAAKTDAACIFGKSWDFQVDVALGIEGSENIAMIADSIALAHERRGEAIFDAEHFFDGYKSDPDYALACIKAAYEAGARWIVLCDTNGGTLPDEIERIVGEVVEHVPGSHLGIHAHNDTGNAVANSLAAVRAGVRHVQGTLNGLGERCGNANLISLIATLKLQTDFEIGVSDDKLAELTRVSRLLDERLNLAPDKHAPYVGESAFAHKGGAHVSAVEKDPRTYEHVEPGQLGNHRHIVVSEQSGRSNILSRLQDIGIAIDGKDPKAQRLVEEVKQQEFEGYAYDGAEASFELLARRALGGVPDYFNIIRFRVMDERRWNARGELVTESEATVMVKVGTDSSYQVANGNGPVNALDIALRKALVPVFPQLESLHLVDYKVRILTPQAGTRAVTRVMIESADDIGLRWTTVGVSGNIIDASFDALRDSYRWKLMRDGAADPDAESGD